MDDEWLNKAYSKPLNLAREIIVDGLLLNIHLQSYMAMFPPALPHYFIRRFTKPGDIVLDPFSGRGTTAVKAMVTKSLELEMT